MMPSAEPSGYSAYSPETDLHDVGFFQVVQSLGTATAASWLLPEVAVLEV